MSTDLGISEEFLAWMKSQGEDPSALPGAPVSPKVETAPPSPEPAEAGPPPAVAAVASAPEVSTSSGIPSPSGPPPQEPPELGAEELVEDRPLGGSEEKDEQASREVADLRQVVLHAAADSLFFSRKFFPQTFRQDSPKFHNEVWNILDDPSARYVNIQMFRGSGKTSLLRTYIAKRLAYGLSRTILYLGASQPKAADSLEWVKNAVTRNKEFSGVFQLSKGSPWTTERARVLHDLEGFGVVILAMGVTGSVRGVNIDDYRPDLIICDDLIAEENSATPDARRKIAELILGAVKESLAPVSECPDAKMAIINTPQDFEDLSQLALHDTEFRSVRFGCWTPETENLPLEFQESIWPERWSSEVLRAEKAAAVARNMLSTFAREKECRLVTTETSSFRPEWIRYFGEGEVEPEPPLHETWVVLVIDPVPPPSEVQIAKGLQGKDFEAITAMGRWKGKYYVLETICNRGHEPNWTISTIFEMANRWKPRRIIVESVAYQRTLAWLIRQAMKRTGRYWPVEEFVDKRRKLDRIKQALSGPLSNHALFFRKKQVTLISQVIHYPGKNPTGTHDDELETVAIGCQALEKGSAGDFDDEHYKYLSHDTTTELDYRRGAP